MMHLETWQLIHHAYDSAAVLSFISTAASVAVRILPPPDELAAELGRATSMGWYRVVFNTLRRISLNAPFQPRQNGASLLNQAALQQQMAAEQSGITQLMRGVGTGPATEGKPEEKKG